VLELEIYQTMKFPNEIIHLGRSDLEQYSPLV
jgi:hypothetical protein